MIMSELISINEIIDIIKEKLSADGIVVLKVTGNSMYRFCGIELIRLC